MQLTYGHRRIWRMLLGAILTAIPCVAPQLGWLQWIAMVPLMVGVYQTDEDPSVTAGRMYKYGFLTVYAYYLVIYHWFFALYPLDFVGLNHTESMVVILAGWLGLSLLQAIPGGLVFLLYRLLGKTGFYDRAPLLRPFVFAGLWVCFEWCSTLSWAGVPWGRLCLGQADCLPMLQSASLLGSYFVSWLILIVNGLIAYAILYHMRASLCTGLATALLCVNFGFGWVKMNAPQIEEENIASVAVIQGNIDSHEKWDDSSEARMRRVHADLTRKAAAEGAEIVLWAETAIPYVLNQRPDLMAYVSKLAKDCGVTLVVGSVYEDENERQYNALYMIDPDGEIREDFYAKRHLVPFGEYVPFRSLCEALIPPLAELTVLSDMAEGKDPALFDWNGKQIGSLICFDSIYEQLQLDSVRQGAELMLLSTNDSWFGDSTALYMHLAQAQLRAIETDRFVVRAANTGISAVFTPHGERISYLPPETEGYAVAEIAFRENTSLYTLIGNLFVYLCIAFYLILFSVGLLLRSRKPKAVVMAKRYGSGGKHR